MKKSILLYLFLFSSPVLFSQVGGSYTYAFMDMPSTARVTAMGGNLISFKDNDPGQAADNPSLLNYKMDKTMVLSYMNYFADISTGFASYAFDTKLGTFNGSIKYLDYGTFKQTDAGNNYLGEFTANEMVLSGGYGRAIDSSFSVGANAKFVYSNLFLNYSIGFATDLAASYEIKKALFHATMLIKNIGFQIKPYVEGEQQPMPFDVQFGVSKSFKNMPFKFSMIIHNLGKGKLTYPSQQNDETGAFGNSSTDNSESTFENVIRHFIVAAEMFPGRNFNLRFGYNFQRRKEMQYEERPATVGLSWGFGLKIAKFHFSYARSAYHLYGSPNHITVLTRFSDWSKS